MNRESCFPRGAEKLQTMDCKLRCNFNTTTSFRIHSRKSQSIPDNQIHVPTRNLGKWYCIIPSRGSETIMIIQSPLHKPSRVFTIHSFSNSLSLTFSLSLRMNNFSLQFETWIRDINRFYQPFSQRFQTRLTPLRGFPSDSKLRLCVYRRKYQPSCRSLRARGANRRRAHVRTKRRAPISLRPLGSQ